MVQQDDDEEEAIDVGMVYGDVPKVMPGERVQTEPGGRNARVMYVGQVPGMPAGYWIGVQYDDKVGKNDGTAGGRRYFRCPPGHGGFLRPPKIKKLAEAVAKQPEEQEVKQEALKAKKAVPSKPLLTGGDDKSQSLVDHMRAKTLEERDITVGATSRALVTDRLVHSRGRTIESWKAEVGAKIGEVGVATPMGSYASGPGIAMATVGSIAQFTINAADVNGDKVTTGGSNFLTIMRGKARNASQPMLVRTKLTDRGDGSYMCEYRPWLTGIFDVFITLDGCDIVGSPYELTVITLRPDAVKCDVRGEALRHAVARTPARFDVLFVDAMGHPAQAEDVDVYVERESDSAPTSPKSPKGVEEAAALSAVAAAATRSVDLSDPAEQTTGGADGESAAAGGSSTPVTDKSPSASRSASPEGVRAVVAPAAAAPVDKPALETVGASRGRRLSRSSSPTRSDKYRMLDAPTRQRHLQLWASRQAADRLIQKQVAMAKEHAGEVDIGKKKGKMLKLSGSAHSSFSHELSMDPYGFAFGGVDPGTLHAHGKIIKVHTVHYSVGLAGAYKLHVGLRQQGQPLPGSPFNLVVEPSVAYAGSTHLPQDKLPLQGIADEGFQNGLIFVTADVLGNMCLKGGAEVDMKASAIKEANARGAPPSSPDGASPKSQKTPAARKGQIVTRNDEICPECEVKDRGDGSYELLWMCQKAGTFPIDVMISGAHVRGSPMKLTVSPAVPAVERFVVSGVGLVKAVAGVEAILRVRVADRFENTIYPSGKFPYTFGLLLVPSKGETGEGAGGRADKKLKASKEAKDGGTGKNKGRESEKDSPSRLFYGQWVGNSYELAYVAEEAGAMDLHLWVVDKETTVASMTGAQGKPKGSDSDAPITVNEPREMLPGSPFTVHVSEGNASAIGSFVKEAEAKQAASAGAAAGKDGVGFTAGEHIIIKPQVRDQFGNPSTAPEGALTADHEIPGANTGGTLSPVDPPKMRGGIGSYELGIEPIRAGMHVVHIKLHGEEVTGSPVEFKVTPGPPSVSKCYLTKPDRVAVEKIPLPIVATLVDKYGNKLDRGGVRVDAKALGAAAATTVEDRKDGSYIINITAGAPGEVKLTVRIDSVELSPTMTVTVVRADEARAELEAAPALLEEAPAVADSNADGGRSPAKSRGSRGSRDGAPTPAPESKPAAEATAANAPVEPLRSNSFKQAPSDTKAAPPVEPPPVETSAAPVVTSEAAAVEGETGADEPTKVADAQAEQDAASDPSRVEEIVKKAFSEKQVVVTKGGLAKLQKAADGPPASEPAPQA